MSISLAVLLAAVLALLVAILVLRGRKQRVALGDAPAMPRVVAPVRTGGAVVAPPVMAPADEGRGVAGEAAAAIEDVIGQFIGVDAHPDMVSDAPGAGDRDTLTLLKGLGPKAAARLGELGVSRFAQIAAWDEDAVAAIDAGMGAFKGRIARDRWVEQASLLAAGDVPGFEAEFGKLGG